MVVTDVGGLAEIVPDGRVGYVCEPTAQGVAEAVAKMYEGDAIERFRLNCIEERKRFRGKRCAAALRSCTNGSADRQVR